MRNDFETGYLEHSAKGTTWRKKAAKYLSRVWKNGRWVYEYKITGKGYKDKAKKEEERRATAERRRNFHTNGYKWNKAQAKEYANSSRELNSTYNLNVRKGNTNKTVDQIGASASLHRYLSNEYEKSASRSASDARRYADEERHYKTARDNAINDYATKSLAGVAESTIKKGQNTIAKLLDSLKPQTTVRITSNLMPSNTEKVYKKKK